MTLMRAYEEILNRMKNAYFNECGEAVEKNSRTEKRLEILASELFSISCYGDYIFKQAFVQTATGDSLDKLGELRGCIRKKKDYAHGELYFTINEAVDYDIEIPQNTVCSVSGKPFLQFSVTEAAIIPAGETGIIVPAKAIDCGNDYNADAGTVTVMVNAPIGVAAVTNPADFDGGYDGESDLAYRNRILRRFDVLPNQLNTTSIENNILSLDYVTDCNVPFSDTANRITVFVSTKDNELTAQQITEIRDKIAIGKIAAITRNVNLAKKKKYTLTIEIFCMKGFDKKEITELVTNRVNNMVSALRIGQTLSLKDISKIMSDIEGIVDHNIYSDKAEGNFIYCKSDKILNLKSLAVNCFDE